MSDFLQKNYSMKKILSLIALFVIFFSSCEETSEIYLAEEISGLETFDVVMSHGVENTKLKSTQAPIPVEYFEVYKYKETSGNWVPYSENFSVDVPFDTSIVIPNILNINTRFAIKAMGDGKVLYYGISEQDYSDVSVCEEFFMHFMQSKAELNLDVDNLKETGFEYIFILKYLKQYVDFPTSNRNLPVTNGVEFPVYEYESGGEQIEKVLVVKGNFVTLDGVPISTSGYFNFTHHYGAGAPLGAELEIKVVDDADTILTAKAEGNFVQLGKNHNLTFEHVVDGQGNFLMHDNDEVFTNITIETSCDCPTDEANMLAWWNMRTPNSLEDQTGNENHLTNFGACFYSDAIKTTCGYVEREFIDETSEGYTIGMWIDPLCLSSSTSYKLFGSYINDFLETRLYFDNHTLKIERNNSSVSETHVIANFSTCEWKFVVLDVSSEVTKVYVDDELILAFDFVKKTSWDGTNRMLIGSYDNDTHSFCGYVKSSFVYDKSICLEQVQTLYNNGAALLYEDLP